MSEPAGPGGPFNLPATPAPLARLTRTSNLALFAVFVVALACVAFVQTTRFFSDRQQIRPWLVGLRLALPLLALFITAVFTKRSITAFLARVGDLDLVIDDVLPLFVRCKTISLVLMTLAGLFAAVCLLFGHQTMDVLLAGLPLILMVIGRPTFAGLVSFLQTVRMMREE